MRLRVGDEVRLVRPFRCSGDDKEEDRTYDADLRGPNGYVPVGIVEAVDEWPFIVFTDWHGGTQTLWTDADVVEVINPVSVEEVEAAIRSIMGQGDVQESEDR